MGKLDMDDGVGDGGLGDLTPEEIYVAISLLCIFTELYHWYQAVATGSTRWHNLVMNTPTVAMTVRLPADLKYELKTLSATTGAPESELVRRAISSYVKQGEARKTALDALRRSFTALRQNAQDNSLDDLTPEEIDTEISLVRAELYK